TFIVPGGAACLYALFDWGLTKYAEIRLYKCAEYTMLSPITFKRPSYSGRLFDFFKTLSRNALE
ncbi:hypothetical protein, partial [Heyndrickxia sporothermodurans]|uniref:hypothetical protein n=1 Tax=Heyndrickxia sporothermodurans TaxID=46224 RepID=UPI000D4C158C